MCLSTAYKTSEPDSIIMEYVSKIEVEGNLIIIPSSTHEVLAMDARLVPDCDDLSAFIQQTNMDVVSPSERLSNQVYMYDRKENSIEMVTRNKLDIIPQESKNISYEKNMKPEI